MKKTLSLFLSTLLLGQSLLFAQPTTPQTLAQYQQQAKQAIAQTPWLAQHKGTLITIAGTTVAVGTVSAILMAYQKKKLQQASLAEMAQEIMRVRQEMRSDMEDILANAERDHLQRETFHRQEYQKRIDELNKQISSYKKTYNEHMQVAWNTNMESTQKLRELEKQIKALTKEKEHLLAARQKTQHQISHNLRPAFEKNRSKANLYEELLENLRLDYGLSHRVHESSLGNLWEEFLQKTSRAQRQEVIEKIMAQPVVKNRPIVQQREFRAILEETAGYIESQKAYTVGHILSSRIANCSVKGSKKFIGETLKKELHALYMKLFSKRTVFTLALILGLSLYSSTASAQAQQQARRIQDNFNLFLNATPEQLALLEKQPETKQACIEGTEAVLLLSQMNQEEAESFLKAIQTENSSSQKIKILNTY